MPHPLRFALVLGCVLTGFRVAAADLPPSENREIENLAIFARVYGYVRFFHPSDEATSVDWTKLAIVGVEEARNAADRDALQGALERIFRPVAPRIQFSRHLTSSDVSVPATLPVTFWQYRGINLSVQPGAYSQRRVIVGASIEERHLLFEPATPPPLIERQLSDDLALTLPSVLPVEKNGATPKETGPLFVALPVRLAALDLKALTPEDWRARVASVVIVWNIFQHFHPYLDRQGVHWEDVLRPALRRALRENSAEGFYLTLSEMIAHSNDGHGFVYGRSAAVGGWPVRVALVEGRVVVTAVKGETPLRQGDIIQRVDGVDALDILHDLERYTPGSPHLREFRALNQFGEGTADSVAQIEIGRDDRTEKVELKRDAKERGYFFKSLGEFAFPGFTEIRPGIFYLNLYSISVRELEENLPRVAKARGVIFDNRWDGRRNDDPRFKMPEPARDVIPHLISEKIQASPMLTPKIVRPDRAGWDYAESTWPVAPKSPRFKGRVVFINEPSVVSYGETCMAMIADYHLATLVGAPTAGCNGNANFIDLPCNFRVMWTGMDVRKHDHSSFYGAGFPPDIPVTRSLRAVKEHRDEYLEAAIAYLEKTTANESAATR